MKKMKEENPYSVLEDPKIRFKHQSLLQDFEDLQKETDAMKKKLWVMKQRKQILSAEVGFLRQRYEYLKNNLISTHRSKKHNLPQPKHADRRSNLKKGKSSLKKQTIGTLTNQKEKICHEAQAPLQKMAPIFDLNQRSEFLLRRGFTTLKSSNLDLNRGIRTQGGDDLGKNIIAPIFDLNQISREEEELEAANNLPLNTEETKKGGLRNDGVEEQHSDMKMSICRNAGNGSRRVGKRKISWQDQVALRV